MIHFIHSYSTKPSSLNTIHNAKSKKRDFVNMWCYALSLAYLKREGFQCNLHTDTEGKKLLGFLPYDNIYLTCDKQKEDKISPRFWAAAKFYALQAEDLDAIHIDGDVFIKDKDTINVLADIDFDALVQSTDPSTKAYDYVIEYLRKQENPNYMEDTFNIDIEDKNVYNTGILWIRNQQLKDKFLNTYFEAAEYYSQQDNEQLKDKDIFPDIVLEQTAFKQLSENYNVKKLLEDCTSKEEAKQIGYQHLLAFTKYQLFKKVKETLHKIDPEIYELVKEHADPIEKSYNDDIQEFIRKVREETKEEGKSN